MNASYNWLRSLAPTIEGTPSEIAARLGLLGAPVDELTELGSGLGDVVIARVEEVRQHPNADRLRICTVNAGGEALQVVCGAPNVTAGGFYPFAPVGARLPGGLEIRKAKLRGEVSEGMLCSTRELGLGRDHTGIMTLNGEWSTGTSFVEQLQLDDARLVVDLTPNRADLLSHLGIARELAPGGVDDIRLDPFSADGVREVEAISGEGTASGEGVRVAVESPEDCPRYMAAVIEGVRVGPSPEWLATRLRAVGLRPINNVVDATNYVLMELGQPLHAFDLDRLAGPEIQVRRARPDETIRTLDGVDRRLGPEALVIADAERPVALAGVMGGEDSEVGEGTTRLLLECALFDAGLVRKTARPLGLSTDASHRFERGVDPELQPVALGRLIDLILVVAGGRVRGPVIDVSPGVPERRKIALRPERVHAVLGVRIDEAELISLLRPIGFAVRDAGGSLQVEVPPFRPDVTREIDVIEEVARRRGYDSFDATISAYRPGTVPPDPLLDSFNSVHRVMARWGLLEARTAAFAPAAEGRVRLLNPLSSEESHLRDRLVPGLLRRVEHNWSHGVRDVRLYEIGTVFRPADTGHTPEEEIRLALVLTGRSHPPHWAVESRSWDIYDLKGLAEEIARTCGGVSVEVRRPGGDALLEPSETLVLKDRDGVMLGAAGQTLARELDAPAWADPVYALEIRLQARPESSVSTYRALPAFPGSERDLALLLPEGLEAARVEQVITAAAGELLERVWPFDLYVGKGIPEGTRSVAWRLAFRSPTRTLTDEEIEASVARVVRSLEKELDVHRR
jgi:phenylalanyl-tRNA synthetase beta chain